MNISFKDFPVFLNKELIWGDMDAYQHINNTVYFRYFEDVRMAYFEKIGVNDFMQKHSIGPILASTKAEYKAPLVYPDTVTIAAKIYQAHGKKIHMNYAVFSQQLDTIVAEGEALVIYFNYAKKQSCAIPEKILNEIKRLEKWN